MSSEDKIYKQLIEIAEFEFKRNPSVGQDLYKLIGISLSNPGAQLSEYQKKVKAVADLKLGKKYDEAAKFTPVPSSKLTLDFKDIAGMKPEKREIYLSFIYPTLFPGLFERSKGFIMWGMPGTGKTFLVKGLTKTLRDELGTNNINLFVATGAEMKGKYVGDTEKKIKKLFKTANDKALATNDPSALSIIFLDEIDAIAVDRSKVYDPVAVTATNALLQQMDGVTEYEKVVVVGATNRIWSIDSGVARRFGFELFVDLPGKKAREQIICQGLNNRLSLCALKEIKNILGNSDTMDCCASLLAAENKVSVQTNPKLKQLVDFIQEFVDRTGMSRNAPTTLANIPELKKVRSEKQWAQYLQARGHRLSSKALSVFGYNISDIKRVLDKTLNSIAFEKLTGKLQKKCSYIKVRGKSICSEDAKTLKLTLDDVTYKNTDLKTLQRTLKTNPSTSRWKEYVQMMQHLSQQTVSQICDECPKITTNDEGKPSEFKELSAEPQPQKTKQLFTKTQIQETEGQDEDWFLPRGLYGGQ